MWRLWQAELVYFKNLLTLVGKMNRGMTVLATWRLLLGDTTPTDEEYYEAIVLAWCVEFVRKKIKQKSSMSSCQRLFRKEDIFVILASSFFPGGR